MPQPNIRKQYCFRYSSLFISAVVQWSEITNLHENQSLQVHEGSHLTQEIRTVTSLSLSLLCHWMHRDVAYRIATGKNFVSFSIWYLNREFLFDGHHQLHRVQAVQS